MSLKEVFDKAYGHVPKEVSITLDFDLFRGFKYHYLKVIRFFLGR